MTAQRVLPQEVNFLIEPLDTIRRYVHAQTSEMRTIWHWERTATSEYGYRTLAAVCRNVLTQAHGQTYREKFTYCQARRSSRKSAHALAPPPPILGVPLKIRHLESAQSRLWYLFTVERKRKIPLHRATIFQVHSRDSVLCIVYLPTYLSR